MARRIEKLQRDFLWGGLGDEFKYHLVSWRNVCEPLQNGGLGIQNLVLFNQALLGKWLKWLWQYVEREAPWRRVIDFKYGSLRGGGGVGFPTVFKGLMGFIFVWKSIRKGWEKFCSCVSFKVGDSSSVIFWHDPWCGGPPLKEMFPELLAFPVTEMHQ